MRGLSADHNWREQEECDMNMLGYGGQAMLTAPAEGMGRPAPS